LVSRIGVLLGMSDEMADVATTLLETHIDAQVLSGEPFVAQGLVISGGPPPEYGQWMLQHWWSNLNPGQFAQREGVRSSRRHLSEWLGWSTAIATRPPLPYRINLLVAADFPRRATESVPWTDVSLELPPSAATEATE
jgi:hypothetical protein